MQEETENEFNDRPVLKSLLSKQFVERFNKIYQMEKEKQIKLFASIGDP